MRGRAGEAGAALGGEICPTAESRAGQEAAGAASSAHLQQALLRCWDFVNGTPREAEERERVSRKEGGGSSKWRDFPSRKARQME